MGTAKKRAASSVEPKEYRVTLRRSVGFRSIDGGVVYKGPGPATLTQEQYDSISLSPSIVETDAAGVPLPHTTAASALGAVAVLAGNSMPAPRRDEDGEFVNDDDGAVGPDVSRRSALDDARAAIDAHAGGDETRTGGTLVGETGEIDEHDRQVLPLPGQTEASASQVEDDRRAQESSSAGQESGTSAPPVDRRPGVESDKPATKSELRALDKSVLVDLARVNRVKVSPDETKAELVDALYDAQVKLD
jgi:hypothetical protein